MSESLHIDHDQEDNPLTPKPLGTVSSPTLDALLSPTDPEARFPTPASIAASDAIDDDAHFSTVTLSSARQSLDSTISLTSIDSVHQMGDRRQTINLSSALDDANALVIEPPSGHKKSASTSTILSGSNVPFMLSHIERENAEGEEDQNLKRSSRQSQQRIHEEFSRKHDDLQRQSEDNEESTVDWNFWGSVISDYQKFAAEYPEELASAIGRGIPKTIRGMIWQLMTASKDPELESTYLKLIKEPSPHEKAITRDLGRTFPHHAFFTDGRGIGQENLFNVLKAYSLYDTQVGYCQGLPFVAAVLLLHMPDEEAFCLLVRLMYSYDLRGHFLPDMPKLQLRLFQFERLIEELAPVLHVHFLRQGAKSSMYCSQWFLTMFSYRFPMDVVFRIYDNCLASGIEAMFSFSLVILLKNETRLLELKFDQLIAFLNGAVFDVYKLESSASTGDNAQDNAKYNVDQFIKDGFALKITSFMLDTYAQEYDEMIRVRDANVIEMDSLRNSNRNLSIQVKTLESSLAQLNAEHCELLNELVRARLKHEDLESELVRYKLLYAEAMHKSEDAMSSHRISLGLNNRKAAILGAIDYKLTFAKSYESDEALQDAYSQCHERSAERVLRALLANGGIFIKLGQHIASLVVLPIEWTSTMRPLQDKCEPTPYEDVEKLFLTDMHRPLSEYFDDFDPNPIGVASLAQVHVARWKETGEEVAVKIQHPHLDEFCEIDMEMVEVSLGWIKHWFPDFEFTWLGEEMRENLPKEMDFTHEARNGLQATADFSNIRTSLYIPRVLRSGKRLLVMEYIQGGRVDDLEYLAQHDIDRNKVALELARIFGQMVHLNGWFHADPHPGTLFQALSKSPYNFEIVLLDHGLYFDLDQELRINYSKFWLALIAPATPETIADRKKYARLVGNIDDALYPVFEAALTGRAVLKDPATDEFGGSADKAGFKRGTSMTDISAQTAAEMEAIRKAVVEQEGLLLSVFDVLRRVPRRVLMVLKLNDLTRSLDRALATTHSNVRVFLVTAKYCTRAAWEDTRRQLISQMRENGIMSLGLLYDYFREWWRYERTYRSLTLAEIWMDFRAYTVKTKAWVWGLYAVGGLQGAHKAAAGLA
ncbi:uncharacterized protein FIBRA_03204 [Fibroporia radiculosa]|uniref:Rab-GAP TBC domain-containing protein n=1 Tax=Fibroporia radiculosa TaxID=599839 RepID=J4I9H2_9APHY|nr:uncharacterized protein FIBRA_03204 [Fibroporia radiculosa]CCM01156.1 predicted protein [Fibroporia radiculosa]